MLPTGRTVCIIDDDVSVRRALGRLMRSVGLDVEVFSTAEEFLQSSAPTTADCLVLDVHLPGLSGLELQERLKADGRDIPIFFISAYAEECVREQALRAGAIGFLQKPFDEQALLDALARLGGAAS